MNEWKRTRWVQVRAPDGSLWCETSDEEEARASMRPGDTIARLYERSEHEWRPI